MMILKMMILRMMKSRNCPQICETLPAVPIEQLRGIESTVTPQNGEYMLINGLGTIVTLQMQLDSVREELANCRATVSSGPPADVRSEAMRQYRECLSRIPVYEAKIRDLEKSISYWTPERRAQDREERRQAREREERRQGGSNGLGYICGIGNYTGALGADEVPVDNTNTQPPSNSSKSLLFAAIGAGLGYFVLPRVGLKNKNVALVVGAAVGFVVA